MVKKWFGASYTVPTINASVSKAAKPLAGAISLLNTFRGRETADLTESQKEYTIKIRMTWHEILILIIYEVINLIAIDSVLRLAKHAYMLSNFNNLQIPDRYVKQN